MRDDDDHARFERPRRRTRPRTKDRPNYDDAAVGRVVTVDRGRYTVRRLNDDGVVTAMKSRPLGRQGVVVGDEVRLVGDTTGDEGSLARIVEVLPRRTVLRRTADDDDPIERIVVANADQLVVVASLADPPPRPGLIDRCLVAAFDAGMQPLVILTKADIGDPAPVLVQLEPLDVPVIVIERGIDLDPVREALAGHTSVLLGHSGVGKSTLVNALVPDADRTTSHVNAVTGRGRQTSTSAMVLELPFGGRIVDTPGFRSFGLAHVETGRIIASFVDLDAVTDECSRGCTHAATEPECGLDLGVADGRLRAERVESFRRILSSKDQADPY
ncbi:putative ribosome small subunit-dependent GTPase A [Aeromicrobium marinum DSM 15272]|uniref:Small ribosomal subunit biogenesis GTPase RsgA n=1 Tax=Aeromicrobium marinum DSM 15272 TaxID=585531 RepID=E2SCL0_9ACTN|nr:ribosome small subunit-dependent GTPase A [Aeromicrobium marinum]EFQ82963.1 putative ribosome small subunit-dependent GTPase A [Aeromicrobium marinum DSM 15272]